MIVKFSKIQPYQYHMSCHMSHDMIQFIRSKPLTIQSVKYTYDRDWFVGSTYYSSSLVNHDISTMF
jgi:lipopolysaccharide biosynthesis glycosyltransferase